MIGVEDRSLIKKYQLRKANQLSVRRLARYLRVKQLDTMSDRQVRKFLHWLLTRRYNQPWMQ